MFQKQDDAYGKLLQDSSKKYSHRGYVDPTSLLFQYDYLFFMSDPADQIIVFDSYDTAMAANLVKTKLDAYGIPCFLSGEHFVGLYPFRNELFSGVRLHIFANDVEQVKDILIEEETNNDLENLHCPFCESNKVTLKKSQPGTLENMLTTMFISPFMEEKKIYTCENCKREFESIG